MASFGGSYTSELVEEAHGIAVELARANITVTAQQVLSEMRRRKSKALENHEIARGTNRWIAQVFILKRYRGEWQKGEHAKVSDPTRNTHATPRQIWTRAGDPRVKPPESRLVVKPEIVGPKIGPYEAVKRDALQRPAMPVLRRGLSSLREALALAVGLNRRISHAEDADSVLVWLDETLRAPAQ